MSDATKRIPQALWSETPGKVFRTDLNSKRLEELDRLRRRAVRLDEICLISYGAQISSKKKGEFGRAKYLSQDPERLGNPKKFYEGSNMRPYGMTWNETYVDMAHSEKMYGPRSPQFFEARKLSIRHISGDSDTFVAWVDEQGFYTDHGVIHAAPFYELKKDAPYKISDRQKDNARPYPLFYLLGIIMSRPARDLYAELYATGSLQGAFSHVYPSTVKGLPIPRLRERPPEPPEEWLEQLEELGGKSKISRTAVRRLFRSRDEAAAVLVAAAQQRQELEVERDKRAWDFAAFMEIHDPGWKWKRGESLENPPDETEFLRDIGTSIISLEAAGTTRKEFRRVTKLAAAARSKASLLQASIDALAASLYA